MQTEVLVRLHAKFLLLRSLAKSGTCQQKWYMSANSSETQDLSRLECDRRHVYGWVVPEVWKAPLYFSFLYRTKI